MDPLWANNRITPGGLSRNYWDEIRYGAWQNSRFKTAWLAGVLLLTHLLGWWDSVTAWIAISDFLRDKFITAGVPAERIFTLRHFWKPQRSGTEQSDGGHYLYLGRLIEEKGILSLLDAWEDLGAPGRQGNTASSDCRWRTPSLTRSCPRGTNEIGQFCGRVKG